MLDVCSPVTMLTAAFVPCAFGICAGSDPAEEKDTPTINLKTIRAAIHVFPICVFYNLPRITVVLTSIERGKNMFRNGRTLFFLVKYPSELRLSCPSYVKIHQALSVFTE